MTRIARYAKGFVKQLLGSVNTIYEIELMPHYGFLTGENLSDHTHVMLERDGPPEVHEWDNQVRITKIRIGRDYQGSLKLPKGTEVVHVVDLNNGSQIVEYRHQTTEGARYINGPFRIERRSGRKIISKKHLVAAS